MNWKESWIGNLGESFVKSESSLLPTYQMYLWEVWDHMEAHDGGGDKDNKNGIFHLLSIYC